MVKQNGPVVEMGKEMMKFQDRTKTVVNSMLCISEFVRKSSRAQGLTTAQPTKREKIKREGTALESALQQREEL